MHEAILLRPVASKNLKKNLKAFLSCFSHEFTEKFWTSNNILNTIFYDCEALTSIL